ASSRGTPRLGLDQAAERFKRELIAVRPEPENAATGGEADIGMMAKGLATENVRQVHLDDRQLGGVERVEDRDRGVGEGTGVQDDPVGLLARLVDPVDKLALVVGLAEVDLEIERGGAREAALLDIGQRVVAVGRR